MPCYHDESVRHMIALRPQLRNSYVENIDNTGVYFKLPMGYSWLGPCVEDGEVKGVRGCYIRCGVRVEGSKQ